jgi:uncharacterized Zn finger protein (UPF0148 family)|tara:strand:- start:355 stop:579 length:225 start_codon:yes stop_codon:yes gene_type:complete
MSVVNFPLAIPPQPISCGECNGRKFFVYDGETFICANCGTLYDWENEPNGNGKEQTELAFKIDTDLLAEVKNAP